jgi:hypothetical protein
MKSGRSPALTGPRHGLRPRPKAANPGLTTSFRVRPSRSADQALNRSIQAGGKPVQASGGATA